MLHDDQKGFHLIAIAMTVVVVAIVVMVGIFVHSRHPPGSSSGGIKLSSKDKAALPDISYFETHKSDQFIVDMSLVQTGFPFKGSRSASPHTGAHAQFNDAYKDWPKGGTAPNNYPPIYAAVDGVVSHIDDSYADLSKSPNALYAIDIAFAKSDGIWTLHYSIEPYVPEPSTGFYKQYIDVKVGDHVKKGQIIAHMYLTKPAADGLAHIHFHLNDSEHSQKFYAPAIFTTSVVQAFHDHWGSFGIDEIHNDPNGPRFPACMGYKLSADENPFGTGTIDCLN